MRFSGHADVWGESEVVGEAEVEGEAGLRTGRFWEGVWAGGAFSEEAGVVGEGDVSLGGRS